ncbi:hypothetical protein O9G_005902 [Rozella allomycis CSF55]|uniref:Uncharacterized protein n=1 Tax=Rozella allomycis (strain CSF55) TaxID=988480 RepID=A0A075AXK8_ROZAC|nr:hypothetical protein O9G_005902 [Rozella allomycis CSF55]|eukprot:EPZ35040.1 hypothetical protein O9G_005902 [Rozella allomycis CSF55]
MKFLLFAALTAVMAHGYRYYRYDYDYSPYHYDDYESYGNKYHYYGKRSDEPQVKGRHEHRQKIVRLEEEKNKSGRKEKENDPNGVGYIFENRPVPVTAYPHARVFGDLIYLSSTSARQLDGTYAGDGSYKLDIEKQSEAALKG